MCVDFLLCDRRRRVAFAFWMSLVWVAFAFWGLDCLQVEAAKVAIRLYCVWELLEKSGKGQIFFFFSLFVAKNVCF
jgi:hypothetical protein